jgi:hypothetical protein
VSRWLGAVVTLACLASTACMAGLPAPTELDARRVTARWPEVKTADLEHGRSLYAVRCSRCHDLYDPGAYSASHWETSVREMNSRAGLSNDEERLVVQYLVAVASRAERQTSSN